LVKLNLNNGEWSTILRSKKQVVLLLTGIVVLVLSLVLNFFVSSWVDTISTVAVGDLFLDVIPIFELNFLFFWAVFIFWVIISAYHLAHPKQLGFLCWSMFLFVLVRCFFISLTHLGPPSSAIDIPDSLSWFNFNADMFFSGHIGGPFLVAMLTLNRLLKRLIIIYCIGMVAIVLMAHGHYSIDIFASFFIAHSISVIVKKRATWFYSP